MSKKTAKKPTEYLEGWVPFEYMKEACWNTSVVPTYHFPLTQIIMGQCVLMDRRVAYALWLNADYAKSIIEIFRAKGVLLLSRHKWVKP